MLRLWSDAGNILHHELQQLDTSYIKLSMCSTSIVVIVWNNNWLVNDPAHWPSHPQPVVSEKTSVITTIRYPTASIVLWKETCFQIARWHVGASTCKLWILKAVSAVIFPCSQKFNNWTVQWVIRCSTNTCYPQWFLENSIRTWHDGTWISSYGMWALLMKQWNAINSNDSNNKRLRSEMNFNLWFLKLDGSIITRRGSSEFLAFFAHPEINFASFYFYFHRNPFVTAIFFNNGNSMLGMTLPFCRRHSATQSDGKGTRNEFSWLDRLSNEFSTFFSWLSPKSPSSQFTLMMMWDMWE